MDSPSEILSDNGPLAEYIEGFKARSQQQDMSETIYAAIKDTESLICEAGTGTGKTFAYLVPVILSGNKVIISTGTKHLQDQLYQKDMPLILKALNVPINTALLKGRANYLCLQRLDETEEDSSYLAKKSTSHLFHLRQWSSQTDSGDLAELSVLPEDAPVRNMVTSSTENCLNQDCDYYDKCFVFKARKRANESDLIIINHHLFLADMALRDTGYGELLPVADTVVFDEAHKIPELASQFFSKTQTSRQILELIRDTKTAYYIEAADLPEFLESLDNIEKSVRDMRLTFGRQDLRAAWHEQRNRKEVMDALDEMLDKFHDLHRLLDDFSDRGKQLDNCFKRLNNILNLLDSFIEDESNDTIQWVETRGQGFFFHQTPLDIAEAFQSHLTDYGCQSIYTSATLSVNKNFKHFAGQLGMDEVKAESWESPFNFKSQALCYLPQAMPDPRETNYTEIVVERALPVLKLTRGRAFILFTSYRAMNLASELLRDRLDYPMLVQGDAPRTELLESFREQHHSVLLGTSSFWEGVDVRGQALACVIIDKLPFAAPNDPVLQARMKKMEEAGRNPFMEYQVPEAVITLKQGVGRLIRDAQDYGVLMICDPRLKSKSYGKIFLRSLPEMPQTSDIQDVEKFLKLKENSE